jgi:hypothetical protein
MSAHKNTTTTSTDREQYFEMEYPNPDWTPKQKENWESSMKKWYNKLETDVGRRWARACYRPKKRNEGMMERDHVKLGTPEDYVTKHVEDTFDPWASLEGIMMRKLGRYSVDTDTLDAAVEDIVRAKLRRLAETNPERAQRLYSETSKVASLYGIDEDSA